MYSERYRSHHDASRHLKDKYTLEISKEAYLDSVLIQKPQSDRVIYIHVPFCNKICSFCPFHRPDELRRREYHEYLKNEIAGISQLPYINQAPVSAINFGGGTPTSLLPEQMDKVFSLLEDNFQIKRGAEISLETSATELTDEMLEVFIKHGVNRLSIGVQTFDDDARRLLGRRNSGEWAYGRVKRALEYGIENTNIDLIYNYPGQDAKRLEEDIERIKELNIAGLSFYSLMIHPKTPLAIRLSEYELAEMRNIDHEYELFSQLVNELGNTGYKPLELTKLVRDNIDHYDYMNIRHSGGSCIALGHGAGGNIEDYIYHNSVKQPKISDRYQISSMGRVVSPEYRIADSFIYAFEKGNVELDKFSKELGINLWEMFEGIFEKYEREGLSHIENGTFVFTEKGHFFGNNMISDLVDIFCTKMDEYRSK